MNDIRRSEEEAEQLYGWFDGEELSAEDSVTVGMSEVALVWDGAAVVARLEAGRHQLGGNDAVRARLGQDELYVCFVTVGPVREFAVEGTVDDEEAHASVTLQIEDPERFIAKLVALESEQDEDGNPIAVEDWIAEQIMSALADNPREGIEGSLPSLTEKTLGAAGVTIKNVESVERA